jgi:hypothetical protein
MLARATRPCRSTLSQRLAVEPLILMLLWSALGTAIHAQPNVYWVYSKASGSFNSLSDALDHAQTDYGPSVIKFNIPTTDPGYNSAWGVWTIAGMSGFSLWAGDTTYRRQHPTDRPSPSCPTAHPVFGFSADRD